MPGPDAASLADDLALLRRAAAEAGAIALRYFGKDQQVWMKGGTSPVGEADYATDKFLRETLTAARPGYGWLSEETAEDAARLSHRRQFIVDPIDGTRGFLEGRKTWCVSVAVVEDGCSLAGVLDCPASGEVFHAVRGQRAFLNDAPIAVRDPGPCARLSIGGPDDMFRQLPPQWRGRAERVAYIPSLAYRLAMVACGRLDASFVKPNAMDWDLAAANLILDEAGGAILDGRGCAPAYGMQNISHGALAAGSGALLEAMAATLT